MMFDGPRVDTKRATMSSGFQINNLGFVGGAQVADVEVDRQTGAITVHEYWAAHDVGRAINPSAVEGQIQGGGGARAWLCVGRGDDLGWSPGFQIPSMMDYKIPSSLDVPAKINPIIVEHPDPGGPFGAKGVGEPGLVGVAPTVAKRCQRGDRRSLARAAHDGGETVLKALVDTAPREERSRQPIVANAPVDRHEQDKLVSTVVRRSADAPA